MKYFLDTEFIEYTSPTGKQRVELISIGIVREDGKEFYKVLSDFNLDAVLENDWVRENVYKPAMHNLFPDKEGDDLVNAICEYKYTIEDLKKDLFEFFNEDSAPTEEREIWAWYGAYDFTLLCGVTTFMDAPFRQWFSELEELYKDTDKEKPEQGGALHISIEDARYNQLLYNSAQ